MQIFCGTEGHKYAPTKQSLLCEGKPAMELVFEAISSVQRFIPDVDLSTDEGSLFVDETVLIDDYVEPTFAYIPAVKSTNLKVVLALDISQEMRNFWASTRDALYRLIGQLLPTGTEVSIVTIGQDGAKVHVRSAIVKESNRQGLHGRIPFRLSTTDATACLECGLEVALSLSEEDSDIVLISANSFDASSNTTTFQDLNLPENVHHAFFNAQSENHTSATQLKDQNKYAVPPQTDDFVQNLSEIFLSILRSTRNGPNIECTFKKTWTEGPEEVRGTFTVETSVNTNLLILLTTGMKNDLELFELTSPSGQKYSFPKYDYGVVYFHLESQANEIGVWSYYFKFNSVILTSADFRATLEVLGTVIDTFDEVVGLDFWTEIRTNVIVLYAKLTSHLGQLPIHQAHVTATVYSPEKWATTLTLKDTGTGYPDVTAGDGIYSGYFTGIGSHPGFYSVVVQANSADGKATMTRPTSHGISSQCCGSHYPDFMRIPSKQFQRFVAAKSFVLRWPDLDGFFGDQDDVFPPNRITNLALDDQQNLDVLATFSWTSPGNDYDAGQAEAYEMRCYTDVDTLYNAFDEKAIPVHASLLPLPMPSGTVQKATVNVPWANQVFYFGIVAVDKAGNVGKVSNVVPVFIPEVTTTTTEKVNSTAELMFKVVDNFDDGAGDDSNTIIYLISAGITAFLLILVTLFFVAICKAKKRQKQVQKIQNISSPIGPLRPPPPLSGGVYVVPDAGTTSLPDVTMGENKYYQDVWKRHQSEEPRSIHDCGLPTTRVDHRQHQPMSLLALNNLPSYANGLLLHERGTASLTQIRRSPDKVKGTANPNGGSDCGTSSTECAESEYSDHSGDDGGGKTNVYNVSTSRIVTPLKSSPPTTETTPVPPTPAPRMSTLSKDSSPLESLSERRKRQESLV